MLTSIIHNLTDRCVLEEVKDIDNLDDASTTYVHRRIIKSKRPLWSFYQSVYSQFVEMVSGLPPGIVLEVGAGTGFLKEFLPSAITSDLCPFPWVDTVLDAMDMPFKDNSVSAILLRGVLHHIPDADRFFKEVDRCLMPGGRLIMVEPHNTLWGGVVSRHLHHEAYDPEGDWTIPAGGRLSGANLALPWIVFSRDRHMFDRRFPRLKVRNLESRDALHYILSGGFKYKQFVPDWLWWSVNLAEWLLTPLMPLVGTLLYVDIEKADASDDGRLKK